MRVVFPYFAQLHQVFHSLPIAAELARRHPEVEVRAAGATVEHSDFVRSLLSQYAPSAPVAVDTLRRPFLRPRKSKKRTMLKNRAYLRSFDAVVTPERTSLFMQQIGLGDTRLIWTRHGAGDRAIGFADDVSKFDFVLLAGRKIEDRLLNAGLIRPGRYAGGIYAKFDWLRAGAGIPQQPWFDNDRPIVLYSPHFRPKTSSWPRFGEAVLELFAGQSRYNLIFAPHVRLFDPPDPVKLLPFERFAVCPNIHIDLGSRSCIDMTYVNAAHLYLGDVSSQVAEFVCRPRPCVFLNAHGVAWRDDPSYHFWSLGPVVDDIGTLGPELDLAFEQTGAYVDAQTQYVAETFDTSGSESSAARGADAIVAYLKDNSTRK